jgi:cytoskeletal protein RodZ
MMPSVGETLRRARQQQGLDLSTVAAQTKINAKYLEAIESDNREMLPSGFFYKSFVDQYAKTLALDRHAIEAEVDRVLSADEPLPLPGFENIVARNVPPMRSSRPFHLPRWFASAAVFVLVLAGCTGFYEVWHGGRSFNLSAILSKIRAATPAAPVVHARVERPVAPTLVEAPKVVEKASEKVASLPAARPVKPVNPPEPSAISNAKVQVDLMAREATWLSASSDGKPVFSGTLMPNETKTVSGNQFAKVRIGNAAGIQVRLNGKLLAPLGARGQVLTVLFTPGNFEVMQPPKESD